MSWVAVGVSVGSAVVGAVGQSKAAKARKKANQQAIEEQRKNLALTEGQLNPYLNAGTGSLAQMMALNGGDFSSFKESPDYQFTLQQGLQGLDRSAARRGGLFSGGQSADVMKYASGLASQQYNNYYGKLADLAQMGNSTARGLGNLRMGVADQIGGYQRDIGDARAQGTMGWTNAIQGSLGAFGNGLMSRQSQTQSTYAPQGSMQGFGNNAGWGAQTRNNGWGPNGYMTGGNGYLWGGG